MPDISKIKVDNTVYDIKDNSKMSKGRVKYISGSSENLNNYNSDSNNGFYLIGSGVSNCPVDYSVLLVFIGIGGTGGIQFLYSYNGCYVRSFTGTPLTWTNWKRLAWAS